MTPLIAMPTIALADMDTAGLPPLPVLSAMLRGASRLPSAPDWRHGVLTALQATQTATTSTAAMAACAVGGLAPGAGVCLVTPVHAIAGMSRVYLAPGAQVALEPQERARLQSAFNDEFGTVDVRLHGVGTGWLLQAPCAPAADDLHPELLGGVALAREPASSPAARSLRRLGAEVEMWLAALPLNRAREARGAAPINCFWFSDGARSGPLVAAQRPPQLICSNVEPDAWLAGLTSHCGVPGPVRMARWSETTRAPGLLVVLQPAQLGDALGLLRGWEADWLAPAFEDLAAGRLQALRLQLGRSAWQLPAPRILRWLRRSRPWWQRVQA